MAKVSLICHAKFVREHVLVCTISERGPGLQTFLISLRVVHYFNKFDNSFLLDFFANFGKLGSIRLFKFLRNIYFEIILFFVVLKDK